MTEPIVDLVDHQIYQELKDRTVRPFQPEREGDHRIQPLNEGSLFVLALEHPLDLPGGKLHLDHQTGHQVEEGLRVGEDVPGGPPPAHPRQDVLDMLNPRHPFRQQLFQCVHHSATSGSSLSR